MEEFVYYGILFNIYKDLLTDNIKDIFSLYYEENLTLQEIADLKGVSKSYIGSVITNAKQKLDIMENTLKIAYTKKQIQSILKENNIDAIKNELTKLL